MSASGYVDQRFNLRPPVLAACFAFGVFAGVYLSALRVEPPVEAPSGLPVQPQPPQTEPPEAGDDALSGAPERVGLDPSHPTVAEVSRMPTFESVTQPPPVAVVDLRNQMPAEPPVTLSARVGLTGLNATPPTFTVVAPSPGGGGQAGAGGFVAPGTQQPPSRLPPDRRNWERLAP